MAIDPTAEHEEAKRAEAIPPTDIMPDIVTRGEEEDTPAQGDDTHARKLGEEFQIASIAKTSPGSGLYGNHAAAAGAQGENALNQEEEEKKKFREAIAAADAAARITAQINADMQNWIDDNLRQDLSNLNKSILNGTVSEEEALENLSSMTLMAAEKRRALRLQHENTPPQQSSQTPPRPQHIEALEKNVEDAQDNLDAAKDIRTNTAKNNDNGLTNVVNQNVDNYKKALKEANKALEAANQTIDNSNNRGFALFAGVAIDPSELTDDAKEKLQTIAAPPSKYAHFYDEAILKANTQRIENDQPELSDAEKVMLTASIAFKKGLEEKEQQLEQLTQSLKALDEELSQLEDSAFNDKKYDFIFKQQDEAQATIEKLTQQIAFDQKLNKVLEENGESFKGLSPKEAMAKGITEYPELFAEYKKLNPDYAEKIKAMAQEVGIENIDDLMLTLENNEKAAEISTNTIATIQEKGGRHLFLKEHLNLVGESELKQAWNSDKEEILRMQTSPLEDDNGNLVHHNERGLYHMTTDDFGKVSRTYYTDPLEIAELRAKAWDKDTPLHYANETLLSEDPQNGMTETFKRDLNEQTLLAQIKENEGKALSQEDLPTAEMTEENTPENITSQFGDVGTANTSNTNSNSSFANTDFKAAATNAVGYIKNIFPTTAQDTAPDNDNVAIPNTGTIPGSS